MRKRSAWKLVLSALLLLAGGQTLRAQSPPAFVVRGEVHDSSGRRVGCAQVCVIPENPVSGEFFPCALTTADGKFLVGVEKPGKYRLIAARAEEGYMSQYIPFYRQPAAPVPEIILDGGSASAYVQINLGSQAGLLTGRIVDTRTGRPVENATIVLCHAADPSVCFQTGAKNAEGKFSVRAGHAPFRLRIKADGFEDWLGLSGTNEEAISVGAGMTVELPVFLKRRQETAASAISEAEKLSGVNLPAPATISPADNAVFDHFPRRTRLEWKPVAGAASYAVEVDYCPGRRRAEPDCANPQPLNLTVTNNPPASGIMATSYEFYFVGAQPGRWRVWAVDHEGRAGFKSAWRKFTYKQ